MVELFNLLTGRSLKERYNHLLVAPATMKRRFIELIDREIHFARAHAEGKSAVGGRIMGKMNALEDHAITEKLYEASQAGVEVTLFVRGFCCLRPGKKGVSENIRVISVVGRFLEHSRLFHFGAGYDDPAEGDWFIGSADWMHRNLHGRVEAVCPVYSPEARQRLAGIIDVMHRDHRKAWELREDGVYVQRMPPADAEPDSVEAIGTFEALIRDARGVLGSRH